jgi:hypothetical protein
MSSPDQDSKEYEDPSILTEESPNNMPKGALPVTITLSEFKFEIERQ